MNTHPFPKSSAVSGSQRSIAAINSESVMVSPLVFGCWVRASIISPLGWPPYWFVFHFRNLLLNKSHKNLNKKHNQGKK